MRVGAIVAAWGLALGVACTVDELVGSNTVADGGSDGGFDGGTPICPGTDADASCSPTCGDQVCRAGCTGLHDCLISCSGTSCSFHCESPEGLTCSPTCAPAAPCTMQCTPAGEEGIDCVMQCEPLQTCAADCHGGTCTVACGQLEPATPCDGGVYSCSGTCPP